MSLKSKRMHIPKHFEVNDHDEIFSFIEANAFGQLISNVDGKLVSTHIPFLVSADQKSIIGHTGKQNPQHVGLDGTEVMIALQGAHDYISPSWYSSSGVPTWNYQAVHIYGHCRIFHDTDKLKEVVDSLANKYEAAFAKPWQPHYQATMLRAIVGVEVNITEIQCQYKLSQNRSARDQSQVVEQLKILGSDELAGAMERNRNNS